MENKLEISKGISGYGLKIIGIAFMVLDHIHQMFYAVGAPLWLTMAGRIVAPIFLFLSAEGFYYTRSKPRYLLRLLSGFWVMSALSSILQQQFPHPDVVLTNSIFGTLFLTAFSMWMTDLIRRGFREKSAKDVALGVLGLLLPIVVGNLVLFTATINTTLFLVLFSAVPTPATVEGGLLWILLGVGFYLFRNRRVVQVGLLCALSLTTFLLGDGFQWLMIFAAIPILLYNGTPGRKSKWFFYIFYPAHIYLLYLISYFLQ